MQPALVSNAVVSGDPSVVIKLILKGPAAVLPPDRPHYSNVMPAFAQVLSDQDIADAESYNAQYGRYVDYVKQMVPELAAQADADAANVTNMLSKNSLQSPAVVGVQAFEDEVARRAALLGAGVGAGILLYLAIPVILATMLSGRGR